jgi:hypothetical protein
MRACRDCNARYFHVRHSLIRVDDLRGASKRFYLLLAMAAAALFVTAAILWFSRQSASATEIGSIAPFLTRT